LRKKFCEFPPRFDWNFHYLEGLANARLYTPEKRRIEIKGGLVLITSYWERQVGGKVTKVSNEKKMILLIFYFKEKD